MDDEPHAEALEFGLGPLRNLGEQPGSVLELLAHPLGDHGQAVF